MAKLIEENGYPFLDMNRHLDDIGLEFDTDIRDYGTHTNVLGAEKITNYFENYIKENYIDTGIALTTDHRGDSKYSSWDNAYRQYIDEIETARNTTRDNAANKIYYEMEE